MITQGNRAAATIRQIPGECATSHEQRIRRSSANGRATTRDVVHKCASREDRVAIRWRRSISVVEIHEAASARAGKVVGEYAANNDRTTVRIQDSAARSEVQCR